MYTVKECKRYNHIWVVTHCQSLLKGLIVRHLFVDTSWGLDIQGMNDEMFGKCFEVLSRAMPASFKLVCTQWLFMCANIEDV